MKEALAIFGVSDDIAAVRHDLPHMPSLGVSSLDSRPPWRHGGLLFCHLLSRQGHGRTRQGTGSTDLIRSRGCLRPTHSRMSCLRRTTWISPPLSQPIDMADVFRVVAEAAARPNISHRRIAVPCLLGHCFGMTFR